MWVQAARFQHLYDPLTAATRMHSTTTTLLDKMSFRLIRPHDPFLTILLFHITVTPTIIHALTAQSPCYSLMQSSYNVFVKSLVRLVYQCIIMSHCVLSLVEQISCSTT